MQEALVTTLDDTEAPLRLLHRLGDHAGALGAARRTPAGNGYEAPGAVRRSCIAIGPGVSLS
jgi:hypothetical protein